MDLGAVSRMLAGAQARLWLERAWHVLVIGSSAAAAWWLLSVAHSFGEYKQQAACAGKQSTQLEAALTQVSDLQNQMRRKEAENASALNMISTIYQKDLQNAQTAHERALASSRAGAVRLRAPVQPGSCAARASAPAGSGPGRRDGAARAELSAEAAEFLLGLASEADTVALQLAACQDVVRADRMTDANRSQP